jgi:hypothetical protein
MKKLFFLCAIGVLFLACKSNTEEQNVAAEVTNEPVAFAVFGEEISIDGALTKEEMSEVYARLQPGDTVMTKFRTTINEVCQMKGCWMKLDLGEQEAMVKFKDYGFFMPKNADGDEVIVEGKAFVKEMSVSEQKHYLEDAGKNQDEIDAVTEAKRTLSFEAHGVLLKE